MTEPRTRCSRAKFTLPIMELPLSSAPIPCVTEALKESHGSNPLNKKRAKFFRPLGSPAFACTSNTYRNAKLNVAVVIRGFISDHPHPKADPRYRVRRSRPIRFRKRSLCSNASRSADRRVGGPDLTTVTFRGLTRISGSAIFPERKSETLWNSVAPGSFEAFTF
jgi:hypothetical protein